VLFLEGSQWIARIRWTTVHRLTSVEPNGLGKLSNAREMALLCLVFGCVGMEKARWRIIDTILHYGCRGAIGPFSGSTVEPVLSLFCI
jgi:hypothetical protein